MACELISCNPGDIEKYHLMPGWGCCQCRHYNGLQRKQCKNCKHECCIEKPLPEKFGLCNECGVPKGMNHIGHIPNGLS